MTFKTNALTNFKLNDEEILLHTGPEAYRMNTGAAKKALVTRWIICAALAVAISVIYAIIYGSGEHFQPLAIVVVVCVFGYIAIRPILDRTNMVKKLEYLVTDKRVIIGHGERDVYELSRSGLKTRIVEAENGCVHIALGKCVELPDAKLRSCALQPKRDGSDAVVGLVLYNVKMTDKVKELFVS